MRPSDRWAGRVARILDHLEQEEATGKGVLVLADDRLLVPLQLVELACEGDDRRASSVSLLRAASGCPTSPEDPRPITLTVERSRRSYKIPACETEAPSKEGR